MLVFEFKAYGNKSQFAAVNEAIRTAQFVHPIAVCAIGWTTQKSTSTT